MPTPKTKNENGIEYHWNEYTPNEMPKYWQTIDRYHYDAASMHKGCIVVECNEEQAKEMAAHFVNNLFAIATCTYYNGEKLSLCCDYAGSNTGILMEKTKRYVDNYMAGAQA